MEAVNLREIYKLPGDLFYTSSALVSPNEIYLTGSALREYTQKFRTYDPQLAETILESAQKVPKNKEILRLLKRQSADAIILLEAKIRELIQNLKEAG